MTELNPLRSEEDLVLPDILQMRKLGTTAVN